MNQHDIETRLREKGKLVSDLILQNEASVRSIEAKIANGREYLETALRLQNYGDAKAIDAEIRHNQKLLDRLDKTIYFYTCERRRIGRVIQFSKSRQYDGYELLDFKDKALTVLVSSSFYKFRNYEFGGNW